ncbi:MAG: methylmalonyl Co-A mutase-associated GTPase MeaB [Myxococcota bacterium]
MTAEQYAAGVLAGERGVLSRAMTLIESRKPSDQPLAQALIAQILPYTGRSFRVGITGVPGVGKSTFIEALGMRLLDQGMRVAVLAVDPSSSLSGGSILGDKTRMVRLSMAENAFIRPSPSGLSLGGVARRTRETLLLCEAAGFEVILVETVGVGQSETVVADMVDFFLALMLPGAGDELQGIKKGLLELADAIVINKADGDNVARARSARREYAAALHYLRPRSPLWKPEALTCSALTGEGLDDIWSCILQHRRIMEQQGGLTQLRQQQRQQWMWERIRERLLQAFRSHPLVSAKLPAKEDAVRSESQTPDAAALELLEIFGLTGTD